MPTPVVIHQFVPSVAPGDGVTNAAFYTQQLLRQLGCVSACYSHRPPFELRDRVEDIHLFNSSACDLLLVHHSMGHDLDQWLAAITCPMVMVYHNITPAHYFPEGSGHHFYALKGRQQLADWPALFLGAIGDSPLNSSELEACGYRNITTLPLLVNIEDLDGPAAAPPWPVLTQSRPVILSVGRLTENKRQDLLVDAMAQLRAQWPASSPRPLLVLAGPVFDNAFEHRVRARIRHWGLEDDVLISGRTDNPTLRWLYRHSAVYWCASEHEGFCMPLVEAGFHGVPVVAFAASNIPHTLGQSGLILEHSDPAAMAAATCQIVQNPALRDALALSGRRNLDRFDAGTLAAGLLAYLKDIDIIGKEQPL